DDGRYEFRDAPVPVRNPEGERLVIQVAGTAPGQALAWSPVIWVSARPDLKMADRPGGRRLLADPQTLDLTFGPLAEFAGRIINERGEPAVGAEVWLRFVDCGGPQGGRVENTSFVTLQLAVADELQVA